MMTRCIALLSSGLVLAAQLRRMLQVAVALHASLAAPVSSARLEQLSHVLSLLKVRPPPPFTGLTSQTVACLRMESFHTAASSAFT